MKIKPAIKSQEIDAVRRLFREYEAFLNVDLCFQDFEAELVALPGKYAPPEGGLLIGTVEDKVVGCVAVRKLSYGVCEMKRMYVQPEARGLGMGRRLALGIIHRARELGYGAMRLDTLKRLTKAIQLYRSLGFKRIKPYYDNPLSEAVYLELDLTRWKPINHRDNLIFNGM